MPEIVLLPIFLVIVLDTFFFLNVLCNLDVLLIHIVSLKLSALEKPYTCDQGVSLIVMLLTEEVHGLSSVSSVT